MSCTALKVFHIPLAHSPCLFVRWLLDVAGLIPLVLHHKETVQRSSRILTRWNGDTPGRQNITLSAGFETDACSGNLVLSNQQATTRAFIAANKPGGKRLDGQSDEPPPS